MTFEEKIQAVDNLPDIMNHRFEDGSSIWLTARFMLRLQHLSVASATKKAALPPKSSSKADILKYILYCFWNGPWRTKTHKDIISIANFEGNKNLPNRMTFFLNQITELSRVEWLYSPGFVKFSGIKNTFSFDYFYFRALLHKKLFKRSISSKRLEEIQRFTGQLKAELGSFFDEKYFSDLQNQLISIDGLTVKYRSVLGKYLSRINPKLIVCSEGNNGDWRHGILFSETKKYNIPTSEVQHGAFNLGMKFGEKIVLNSEFKQQKSDYLFTFGNFHSRQTNVSSRCIALGHYHMEILANQIIKNKEKDSDNLSILFICEGEPPSSINNGLISTTVQCLRELNMPFELVVRLHPSEKPNEKYHELLSLGKSKYSTHKEDSIYQLIWDADIIISHASTVVFESLYFKKVPFIYHDNATELYIPKGIGRWFTNAEELKGLIRDCNAETLEEDTGEYWTQGGVVFNFNKFWKQNIAVNN